MIHSLLALAALVAGVKLNAGMIRRRWLSGQPPLASEGSRGRLAGELGAAALGGYLLGRRRSRIRQLEERIRELEEIRS